MDTHEQQLETRANSWVSAHYLHGPVWWRNAAAFIVSVSQGPA